MKCVDFVLHKNKRQTTYSSIGLVSWLMELQTRKPVPEDEVGSLGKIGTGFPLEHPCLAPMH